MSLLVRIKQLSKEKKQSVAEIEKALNMGNGTIRRWDIHAPSVDKVIAVAQLLDVSVEYLLTGKSSLNAVHYSKRERDDILHRAMSLEDEKFDALAHIISVMDKKES